MAGLAALAGGDTNSGQQVQVQPHAAAGSEDNLLILGKTDTNYALVLVKQVGSCV